MKEEQILDNPEVKKDPTSIKSLILWWELKRAYYNIILVGSIVFVLYDLWEKVVLLGFETVFGYSMYFLFGANLFYTSGWIAGLMVRFFYGAENWHHSGRWILIVLGTVFSIFWMIQILSISIIYS